MARILVTGAAGFIGRGLCPELARRGHQVVAAVRAGGPVPGAAETRVVGEIGLTTEWSRGGWSTALHGSEIVIHLAQRAHRRADAAALASEAAAAAGLARAAVKAGVRRLVYLSSIKAMGEETSPGRPFRADTSAMPGDAYGRAKLATERALREIAAATGLELVVLRPPLVYGPGVGGNFHALLRLAGSGLPLPFAAVDNRRSLVFRDNLVDLLGLASVHPAAAGQVLLAADGADLSTPHLLHLLAMGQRRPARLFALPGPVFAIARRLPAIGPAVSRLTRSLQVDDTATRALLRWTPPVAGEAGLLATARAFVP